ncbi:MAG: MFS transporter [Chloroflexota bacterium]
MKKQQFSLWQVMLPAGLGTMLSLFGDASLYTILPTHTEEAGITLLAVGTMLSANRFIRLISNGPAGWLSDRLPRRWVFVPSLFLGAISTAVYGVTTGYWPLLIGRLLWGISWSGIWVTGNAIILDIADESNRGRYVGIYNVFFFAGAAGGSAAGGALTDLFGYHVALNIDATISLIGALIALLFLPETRTASQAEEIDETTAVSAPAEAQNQKPVSWPELGSAIGLMGVNRIVVAGMLTPTLAILMLQTFGDSVTIWGRMIGVTTLTGIGLSSSTIIGTLIVPAAGTLSDRLRQRWGTAVAGIVPGIAGFSLLAVATPWAILLGLPLTAVSSGSNQAMSTTLVGDMAGKTQRGRFMGFLFTIGDLGSALGPLVAFWLIANLQIELVYLLASVLLVLMFFVAFWWAYTQRNRSPYLLNTPN